MRGVRDSAPLTWYSGCTTRTLCRKKPTIGTVTSLSSGNTYGSRIYPSLLCPSNVPSLYAYHWICISISYGHNTRIDNMGAQPSYLHSLTQAKRRPWSQDR